MYCPKCSHQVVSNNVRYCPGCGFWLHGVAELIANNGVFTADEEKPQRPRRSMVKRGALLGSTLMFIISFSILLSIGPKFGPVLGSFLSWVTLMALIYVSGHVKRLISKIFSEEEPSAPKKIASPRGPALPASYSEPVVNSGQQFADTSKMAQPSSITEQTTSRFNKV
ncbi:MAG TPA: zinc ribbon domain-containing protein [Blastocatellia bacterium]|nr:zinc ribbon domain-containing protein [Blastocatellia bacterium]